MVTQRQDALLDLPLRYQAQQFAVILLGSLPQPHRLKVEAQEALLLIQSVLDQSEQPLVGRLAVQHHVKQAIEPTNLGVVFLAFQCVDTGLSLSKVRVGEQRNRQAQGLGLQQHAQGIGLGRIVLDQGSNDGTLVSHHMQQGLRLQLAQRFAYRHATDAEQAGQFLLAHGGATGQSPIKDGITQRFFDNGARKMGGNRPADFDAA